MVTRSRVKAGITAQKCIFVIANSVNAQLYLTESGEGETVLI